MSLMNRRQVVVGTLGLMGSAWGLRPAAAQSWDPERIYGPVAGEPFDVPPVNLARIKPQFLRTMVAYNGPEAPGTIVIDPNTRYLHLVYEGGRAIRYGVGVGRQGFAWSGVARIHDKRVWPDWYPPKEMLARDKSIMESMSHLQGGLGMPGGPGNPLGARAMYLFQGNKDTLYRIHGTIEPWTIGSRISSGCIRMINQDVIDLFERVPVGTKVIVLGSGSRQEEPEAAAPDDADPRFANDPRYADPRYADPRAAQPGMPEAPADGWDTPGGDDGL